MCLSQLKKDVAVLHKALNIDQTVPGWKVQSDKVQALLKGYDLLTVEEKDQSNREVLEWYEVVSQNI